MRLLLVFVLAFYAAKGQDLVGPEDLTARLQGPGGPTEETDTTDATKPPPVAPLTIAAPGQPAATPEVVLAPGSFPPISQCVAGCGCTSKTCTDNPDPSDVGKLSALMAGGTAKSARLTNLVWSWGQFLDHDFIASFNDRAVAPFPVDMNGSKRNVSRTVSACSGGKCRLPRSPTTPQIDAGPVYSNFDEYTYGTLKEPKSCKLRTSKGNFPPVSTKPSGFANINVFIAGDSRINEHALMTNIQTIWIREHNRLCDVIAKNPKYKKLTDRQQFDLARAVVKAKIQEITLFEWLPALKIKPREVFFWRPPTAALRASSEISTEFLILYRWGHGAVPNTIGGEAVEKIFSAEAFYGVKDNTGVGDPVGANAKLNKLVRASATEAQAEMDGEVSDALRKFLFGIGLDLAAINIFRAKDVALPPYAELAKCYGLTPNTAVNAHPFVGGMQDNKSRAPGQEFGPLIRRVMIDQFHRAFFGAKGDWWEWSSRVGDFRREIIGTTYAKVINANTKAEVPPSVFVLGGGGTGPKVALRGASVASASTTLDPADASFRPTRG